MARIQDQVHSKFKLFTGKLDERKMIGPLAAEVESFVSRKKVAPKSIGVEYLESSGTIVLSLGYRDDEPGYPVKLSSVSLGKVKKLGPAEREALEKKMAAAGKKLKNVICHELYVTEENDFLMVFMTHREA